MKIGVLGLMKKNFLKVESKYKNLTLVHMERKWRSSKGFGDVDIILVMTRFIGHGLQDSIICHKDKSKLRLVRGGMTKLNEVLEELADDHR